MQKRLPPEMFGSKAEYEAYTALSARVDLVVTKTHPLLLAVIDYLASELPPEIQETAIYELMQDVRYIHDTDGGGISHKDVLINLLERI